MSRSLLVGTCIVLNACLEDGISRHAFGEPLAPAKAGAEKANLPRVLVGVAKIDITPDYPVRLTGYGSRTKESEGVSQKIWAKALVVDQTRRGLERLHAEAQRIAASTQPRDAKWKAVAPLLLAQGLADDDSDLTLLTALMRPDQPTDVQTAVVDALATSRQQ